MCKYRGERRRIFRAFALESAKFKKERESAPGRESESTERERKSANSLLPPPTLEADPGAYSCSAWGKARVLSSGGQVTFEK